MLVRASGQPPGGWGTSSGRAGGWRLGTGWGGGTWQPGGKGLRARPGTATATAPRLRRPRRRRPRGRRRWEPSPRLGLRPPPCTKGLRAACSTRAPQHPRHTQTPRYPLLRPARLCTWDLERCPQPAPSPRPPRTARAGPLHPQLLEEPQESCVRSSGCAAPPAPPQATGSGSGRDVAQPDRQHSLPPLRSLPHF